MHFTHWPRLAMVLSRPLRRDEAAGLSSPARRSAGKTNLYSGGRQSPSRHGRRGRNAKDQIGASYDGGARDSFEFRNRRRLANYLADSFPCAWPRTKSSNVKLSAARRRRAISNDNNQTTTTTTTTSSAPKLIQRKRQRASKPAKLVRV